MCGIYCIENLINNKKYIGQSINIKRRLCVHKTLLNNGRHYNEFLQRAWDKYGADNFNFYVLIECDSEKLDEMEVYYIGLYNTTNEINGYNYESGGHTNKVVSDITKAKIGNSNKGHKHTDEAKKKMSNSHIGRDVSFETRQKISLAEKGKEVSEETRKKLSEINIGKTIPDDVREKISKSSKGKPKTDEHRRKIKENHANTVAVFSPVLNEYFNSVNEVKEKYGIPSQNIFKCLNGDRKSAGKHPITGEKLTWIKLENN